MAPTDATIVTSDQKQRTSDTLVLAFAGDPLMRWLYPDPHDYVRYYPKFLEAFVDAAVDYQSASILSEAAGAALWLPPGGDLDSEKAAANTAPTIPEERVGEITDFFGVLGEKHPAEDHWYLGVLGIEPTKQNLGLGSVLMKHDLRRVDEAGALAYLESSNPRNVPFYERHGFEVLEVLNLQSAPEVARMIREPR